MKQEYCGVTKFISEAEVALASLKWSSIDVRKVRPLSGVKSPLANSPIISTTVVIFVVTKLGCYRRKFVKKVYYTFGKVDVHVLWLLWAKFTHWNGFISKQRFCKRWQMSWYNSFIFQSFHDNSLFVEKVGKLNKSNKSNNSAKKWTWLILRSGRINALPENDLKIPKKRKQAMVTLQGMAEHSFGFVFNGMLPNWSIRPNPEGQKNRKLEGQKIDRQAE